MFVLLHLHAAVVDALDAAEATHILVNAKILQKTHHNVSPGPRSQDSDSRNCHLTIRPEMAAVLYGFPAHNMPGEDEDALDISTVTDQPPLLLD